MYKPIDKALEYYEVPKEVNGMKVIGITPRAFEDCTKCIEIKLPDTLEYIGTEAFENCYSLTNINMPDNLKAIGYWIFSQCENLKYVNIDCPDAIVAFDALEFSSIDNAYLNFKSVGSEFMHSGRNITLGDDVVKVSSAFVDTKTTEDSEIIIPETVKVIINDYFGRFGNDGRMSNDISIPENIEIFCAYQFSSVGEVHEPWNREPTPAYIAVLGDEWYLSDDTIISGYYDTEAHSYALSHNLKFSPLDDLNYCDANNNDNVSIADAVSLQKYLLAMLKLHGVHI